MTELVFILDKSGSMSGLESDTIGGFNAMLDKQKRVEGECFITTALFDNTYELLHNRLPIKAVKAITEKEYCVGGSTAVLDAIGRTVHTIENAQKHLQAEYQAEQVLVVIITDGQENASREYGPDAIKDLIKAKQQEKWEFIFLGANIDAIETATNLGIHADRAQSFHADSEGIQANFDAVCDAVCSVRAYKTVPENWNQEIKQDFEKRRSKKR
ncbi:MULTISPECIES: vWA domain-containing protein [unclassified Sphaerochaeta]|jgi:uncharacterized protein YegL|uniref:vWA domain-containing protein n=1 Tax=unclassified Sphaerochaeta TaxID=2637943 RepID=UPI0025DA0DBE|nr:VWA domain-containing protein [Sphaerochaeta sp. UBA5856]